MTRNIASLVRNGGNFETGDGIGYVADDILPVIPKIYPSAYITVHTKIGKWEVYRRNGLSLLPLLKAEEDLKEGFCAVYYNKDDPLRPRTIFSGKDIDRYDINTTALILAKHVLECGMWNATEEPTDYAGPPPWINADFIDERKARFRLYLTKPRKEAQGLKADMDRVKRLPHVALFYSYGPEAERAIKNEYEIIEREQNLLFGELQESLRGDENPLSREDFRRIYDAMQHIGRRRLESMRKLMNFGIPLEEILDALEQYRPKATLS